MKKLIHFFIFMVTILIYSIAYASDFKIFDATKYKNKPNLKIYNIENIGMIYENEILTNIQKEKTLHKLKLKKKLLEIKEDIICINIECWDPISEIEKYIYVAKTVKSLTNKKFGFYSTLPRRDFYRATRRRGEEAYNKWKIENIYLSRISEYVDIIYPSLYAFNDNIELWKIYAQENINEAKLYEKKVYPFIWPQMHKTETYLTESFWRVQLQTCYENADGVVIWAKSGQFWRDDAEWWETTQFFLYDIN